MPKIKTGKNVDTLTGEVTFYVYDSDGFVYATGFKTSAAAKAEAARIRKAG